MKAYLAGPYASHLISKDAAICDALHSLSRLRHLRPVIHVDEVAPSDRCIWSPLIQGQVILWNTGGRWSEETALKWCLHCLTTGGFDTIIISTSPRRPGATATGVDVEQARACELGYRIMSEADTEGAIPG